VLGKIIRALSSRRSGSHEQDHLLLSGAILIGNDIYLELRKRDVQGNDFVEDVSSPISMSAPSVELGESVVLALKESQGIKSVPPNERGQLWKAALRKMGFRSEKAFVSSAQRVLISGFDGSAVELQRLQAEGDGFAGNARQGRVTVPWKLAEIGDALKSAFQSELSGHSIDEDAEHPPLEIDTVVKVGARVWHIGRQQAGIVEQVDPDDNQGLGTVKVRFDDGSVLLVSLLASGLVPFESR
jgi:hypothetical protein